MINSLSPEKPQRSCADREKWKRSKLQSSKLLSSVVAVSQSETFPQASKPVRVISTVHQNVLGKVLITSLLPTSTVRCRIASVTRQSGCRLSHPARVTDCSVSQFGGLLMTSPQKRILLLSSGALPAAALAAYLLAAPQMAKAGPYCVYAGQEL